MIIATTRHARDMDHRYVFVYIMHVLGKRNQRCRLNYMSGVVLPENISLFFSYCKGPVWVPQAERV